MYEEKYSGHFKQNFDLRKFPYESDSLTIDIVLWRGNDNDYRRKWEAGKLTACSPGGDDIVLPDFNVGETRTSISDSNEVGENTRVEVAVDVTRRPWFYVISSSLSMAIIMLFSLATFGISSDGNGTAIGIIGSLLLATIAVRFVISQDTPRVPYTTAVDREALTTFVVLLLAAFLHTDFNPWKNEIVSFHIATVAVAISLALVVWRVARYLSYREA